MLVHISPQIDSTYRNTRLENIIIEPFGLFLDHRHVKLGQPEPLVGDWVVCSKKGKDNIDGIFLEMPFVDAFSVTTRWSFDNVFTSIHHVDYSILDHDFNAYTDDMGLWWASKQAAYLLRQAGVPESVIRHGWAERGADVRRGQSQPCMSAMQVTGSWPGNLNAVDEISMDYDASCFDEEMFSGTGSIIHRTQAFLMPSIEYWRLVHHPIVHNLPDVLTAFRI